MDDLDRIKKKMMEDIIKEASAGAKEWPGEPVELDDSTFQDFIRSYGLVVVDCWAPWCGPCRMVAPVIEALSKELRGKVAFGKLNTDNNQRTAMNFSIYAIPTLLVFKDGELVDKIVGALPKEQVMAQLKNYM